jgi:Na+/proline symporter
MSTLAYIFRLVSLSFLFGGSASIIFAAITLVKAATAQGMPIPQAAAANAPMFFMFSTVVLVSAIGLLLGEALDYAKERKLTPLIKARYISSLICVAAAMVLKFGIIPQMEQLSPVIKENKDAHAAFVKMHDASRVDFSVIIVCSLISLLLPGFEARRKPVAKTPEAAVAS